VFEALSGARSEGAIAAESLVDVLQGKDLRVESLTCPVAHVLIVFVLRVEEDIEQVGVPRCREGQFRLAICAGEQANTQPVWLASNR